MAQLVLTVVGDDRAGLVNALAQKIAEVGGNWEQSELAELAGAFAGIVLVSVPDDHVAAFTTALRDLDGLLSVTAHTGSAADAAAGESGHTLAFTVLGNDRPGIVRDVTAAIAAHALSIDTFRSRTLEAPMAGGTLFEASVSVSVPASADAEAITRALEALAGEIQVDLTVA
ncbi:MAG: amino acid-binding ACT protein [Microbacterium sp. SCN 70-200]|uniref:glycine cleavage system protein R n=1 Tax=unclassified Microbacterium TaxID=2609290 RepID=UPI00086F82B2|nr:MULTISPECIES: ACT domain-containing protein [unclassified Microbacterium]MBN9214244.1 ACT domain-containing protein [Microbacterium sp.]ODT39388.1 MAG: amino acid-binding ACT protein [Microbacterium sp. SCN 70-200]OJV83930.1 MAG: amino acid-binding ACT protein [Microbacterium sp. 70-16]